MKVSIISGEFKGREAFIIGQSFIREARLCGGPDSCQSVTARIDGMLYPVVLDLSEIAMDSQSSPMIMMAM